MNRALIIKKEWLDLIFSESKTVEIRSSNTKIRGTIGLIESKSGLILGSCKIVNSILIDNKNIDLILKNSCLYSKEKLNKFYKKPYAWFIEDIKKFDIPIKYNHPKGAVIWVDISKQNINN